LNQSLFHILQLPLKINLKDTTKLDNSPTYFYNAESFSGYEYCEDIYAHHPPHEVTTSLKDYIPHNLSSKTNEVNHDWVLLLFILGTLLLSSVRFLFKSHLSKIFSLLLGSQISFVKYGNSKKNVNGANTMMNALYYMSGGLFLSQLYLYFGGSLAINYYFLVAIFIMTVMCFHAFHYIANIGMGFVFDKVNLAKQYNSIISLINQVFGLGLFLITLFLQYGPIETKGVVIILGIVFVSLVLLVRALRMVLLFF